MTEQLRFIFVTCQVGAETAVKREVARTTPSFRFAFSRPGFLTFKLPADQQVQEDFGSCWVFARACGFSLGKVAGDNPMELARQAWQLLGGRAVRSVHAWSRDAAAPGQHGYEPAMTSEAVEVGKQLVQHCPRRSRLAAKAGDPGTPAKEGDWVMDCVLIEPNQWWIGYHQARGLTSRWPGGMIALQRPESMVSRAWLKMEEALRWSEFSIPEEARFAEIGSAPGGASQALLGHGWSVLGIDPAQMDPAILANERFTHLCRRANQVRRREFRKIRWLTADMNVAPDFTLDVVESIVTHWEVNVRGMLLTLKLPEWSLADEVPGYLERIRGWGFNLVRARQLQHNRQEVCVAALQHPFHRKPGSARR